jgi:tRNA A37 threonylcarbamoyladenosine dehydratase
MMTGVKDKATKGSQMPTTPKAPIAGAPGGNEMIKNEMYSRISSFFGADKFRTIQDDAFVIIVGLGGVGSHAANMLIRSGVTNVRIIDFDQVTLSSLNRHAMATLADVGKSKAEVMERRIKEVAPWCKVDAVVEMFKGSEAERLLSGSPTYVLDCIDDVATKAELIAYCVKNKLQVLTSMGAGGKADPTRLRVSALSDCMNDPLASKIKWKLKKHGVSADDVMSVFSIEKPAVELLPLDEEQAAAPQDFGTVDYLRIRVMPVLGTSPAIFGQAMASKALTVLAQQEYNGEVCERMSKSLKHKLLQTCKAVEKRRYGHWDDVDLDEDDIEFAVAQVWGSRCVVTSKRFGGHAPLMLVRWNSMKPPAVDNLVLLSKNNAEKVEADTQDHAKPVCFEPEVTARIEERLAWAKAVVGGSSSNMRGVASPAAMLLSGLSKTWSLLHVAALVAASASLGYGAAKAGALDR